MNEIPFVLNLLREKRRELEERKASESLMGSEYKHVLEHLRFLKGLINR
jgi:hypothetical protein